jgi:CBS domain-containing protein
MRTVADYMSRELAIVEREASLEDAARRMVERRVGSLLVFEGEQLVGIVTERDVLRSVAGGAIAQARVDTCMTRHPETIDATDEIEHAAVVMIHGGFRHLPVADAERIVGILSMRDLIAATVADQAPRGV